MPDNFNPYHVWLGIPPHEQPANYYRLLGIGLFEDNPAVIESAADRQMAHLRSVQVGKHHLLSQRLLNEIAAVRVCLMVSEKKAEYDAQLRAWMQSVSASRGPGALSPMLPASQPAQPAAAPQLAKPLAQAVAISSDNEWDELLGNVDRTPRRSVARKSAAFSTALNAVEASDQKNKGFNKLAIGAGAAAVAIVLVAGILIANSSLSSNGPKQGAFEVAWPAGDRAGVEMTIDGRPTVIPSGDKSRFPCAVGEHQIVIRRPKFKPFETTVVISADQYPQVVPPWKLKSSIILLWPVEDRRQSEVKIDGQPSPVSNEQPLELALQPGEHTIEVTRPGARPFRSRIVLAENERKTIPVQTPQRGIVAIHWPLDERQGALITIDGERVPPLPETDVDCDLSIPLGQHTIRIARPGFRPFEQTVKFDEVGRQPLVPVWISDRAVSVAAESAANRASASPGAIQREPDAPSRAPRVAPDPEDARGSKKHRVPSDSEQQRLVTELGEISGGSDAPSDKLARAKEFTRLAEQSQNPDEQYVLLHETARLASEAMAVELAIQSVDALAADFEIDAIEMKQDMLERSLAAATTPDQIAKGMEFASQIIDEAIAADRYDSAGQCIVVAATISSKKAATAKFRRETEDALARRRQEIRILRPIWGTIKAAEAALESNQDDPPANLTVGRWHCLYKRDWDRGLPLLAKGSDDALAALAKKELASPAEPDAQFELADSWWKLAQKETGLVRDNLRVHAAVWYDSAKPHLTSSVKKALIDRHLAEVASLPRRAEKRPPPRIVHVEFPPNQWVDLMPLLDIKRDAVLGHWSRRGIDISSLQEDAAALALPVVIDGEYDLELTFTRIEGTGDIDVFMPLGPLQICVTLSGIGSNGGFGRTPGAPPYNGRKSTEAIQLPKLDYAKPHQFEIRVRLPAQDRLVATVDYALDGRHFMETKKSDFVHPYVLNSWTLPNTKQAGLGTQSARIALHGARLKMISGTAALAQSTGLEKAPAKQSRAHPQAREKWLTNSQRFLRRCHRTDRLRKCRPKRPALLINRSD